MRKFHPISNFLRNGFFVIGVLFSFVSHAQAQTIDYGSLEALFGEPITTSATGQPQRVPDVPVKMDIITANDIRRSGAHDIPEALRNLAGMSVWQWTRFDEDVSVRGYNQAFSPRLLVLINGRQVYLDNYGYTSWQTLPVEMEEIRQIEVVKGPNAALFGFNAVGGVINIITYNPLYDKFSDAGASVGSNNYWQGHIVHTAKIGDKFGVRLSAGETQADQFSTPSGVTPRLADPWKKEVNLDSAAQLTANSQVRLELSDSRSRTSEYIFLYLPINSDYDTHSAKLTYAASGVLGQTQLTIYRNWLKITPDGVGFIKNEVTVAQAEDLFQIGNNHHFRLGAEYRYNTMFGNLETQPGTDLNYDVASANGMWEWSLTDKLKWTNALREDHLHLWRNGALIANPFYTSNADFDRDLSAFSYNSGLVWQATPSDTLRITAARGVQAPSLTELGAIIQLAPPFLIGNPQIDPTIVANYEMGYDHRIGIIGGAFSTSVFYQKTDDIKAVNVNTIFPFQQADNIGDSHAVGLEAELKGKFRENWTWDANYLLERVNDDLTVNGGGIISVPYDTQDSSPVHTLNAHLGYATGPWEADIFGHYTSDYKVLINPLSGTYNLVDIPHYASINGRIGYKITDNLTLAVSGQELNHPSALQTSGAKAERQVFLSLSAHF